MTTPCRRKRGALDEFRQHERSALLSSAEIDREVREAEEEESRRSERATFMKAHVHLNNIPSRPISRASEVSYRPSVTPGPKLSGSSVHEFHKHM